MRGIEGIGKTDGGERRCQGVIQTMELRLRLRVPPHKNPVASN